MTPQETIKAEIPRIVAKYARRSDARAALVILGAFVPYLALFYLSLQSLAISGFLAAACIGLASMFMVRIFVLLHECGHNSMFRTQFLNQLFGFIAGVFCGMPQRVWSRNHAYHHATNGNWEKYTGPLSTISVEAFAALSPFGQKRYQVMRNIVFTLPGAFMYFIVNPRLNWVRGSVKFMLYLVRAKLRSPRTPTMEIARGFTIRYWQNGTEYWHMFANNVVLLGIWWAASAYFGAVAFFTVYLTSLTIGGAIGIILFSIQHNFEASYASEDADWDYHRGAMEGTSYLKFPAVLNWFLVDATYHHVHHLSARIPAYNLAVCHRENAHLFESVTRVYLRDVVRCFDFILWDTRGRKIISVAQFRRMQAAAPELAKATDEEVHA